MCAFYATFTNDMSIKFRSCCAAVSLVTQNWWSYSLKEAQWSICWPRYQRGQHQWTKSIRSFRHVTESICGMILTEQNCSTRGKPCPIATLSTTNHTRAGLGSNTGLRGDTPASNRLRHDTSPVREPLPVACPGISFGGGAQQIQLRAEDRENGDLGAVALYSGVLEAAVIWYKKFHFI